MPAVRTLAHCATCGGYMAPSQFKDGLPTCLLCGRDGSTPITPEQAEALRKQERAVLGHRYRHLLDAEPHARRGRPPKVSA